MGTCGSGFMRFCRVNHDHITMHNSGHAFLQELAALLTPLGVGSGVHDPKHGDAQCSMSLVECSPAAGTRMCAGAVS
jgi:hypothetical protein